MTCQELAARIEQLHPGAHPREVARLCLLLTTYVEPLEELRDQQKLCEAWRQIGLRLQAATDQHTAMTEELEQLAHTPAGQFTPEQIQTLIRAIKVQSQVLQLYVGLPRRQPPAGKPEPEK